MARDTNYVIAFTCADLAQELVKASLNVRLKFKIICRWVSLDRTGQELLRRSCGFPWWLPASHKKGTGSEHTRVPTPKYKTTILKRARMKVKLQLQYWNNFNREQNRGSLNPLTKKLSPTLTKAREEVEKALEVALTFLPLNHSPVPASIQHVSQILVHSGCRHTEEQKDVRGRFV